MGNNSSTTPIIEFFSRIEPLTIRATYKVLGMKCLARAKENFEIDYLNDIGIINALRSQYVETGDFRDVFFYYQNSRRDRNSHRYESLFATIIISLVTSVIAGVIVENYKTHKEKMNEYISDKLYKLLLTQLDGSPFLNKFIKISSEIVDDIRMLCKGYAARDMLNSNLISLDEYNSLIEYIIADNKKISVKAQLNNKFIEFYENNDRETYIDEDKLLITAKSYGEGVVLRAFDEKKIILADDPMFKGNHIVTGLPASPGYAEGHRVIYIPETTHKMDGPILVIDSKHHSPEKIHLLTASRGVVTWNCGITGHIPVICRGIGIGCVIIKKEDVPKVKASSELKLCGKSGIVLTGSLAKEDGLTI